MIWTYITVGIVLITVFQMRKIFASLKQKAPFDPVNAKRIRIIGLVIIGGQFLGALMAFAFSGWLKDAFASEGLVITPDWGFNIFAVLFGLIILVLSEVFRIGSEMKSEQDLTI